MRAFLVSQAALLQALFEGPGAGQELIERLRRSSQGQVQIRQGPASVALRSLQKQGLVRSWTAPARAGRGRPRRYYELTGRGIAVVSLQREAARGILGREQHRAPTSRERGAMSERLAAAIALSDFAMTLRAAPRRPLS